MSILKKITKIGYKSLDNHSSDLTINRLKKLSNYLESEDLRDEADEVDELISQHDDSQADGSGGDDPKEPDLDVGRTEPIEHEEHVEKGTAAIEGGDDYGWRLYRGKLIDPNGEETSVKRIRGGSFSTVYQFNNDNHNEVLIRSNEKVRDKEILSLIYESELLSGRPANPHLPAVRMVGKTGGEDDAYGNGDNLYVMKRYNTPLRKANTKDWDDYTAIMKCWEKTHESHMRELNPNQRDWMFAKMVFYNTIGCAEEAGVSEQLIEALRILYDGAETHGSENYGFEISPRNVGSDEHGNIVFFDVMYDYKQHDDIMRNKRNKRW